MKKSQVNIRMSEATRAKLDWLTKRHGTQAEAVAVAIDQLYARYQEWMKEHPGHESDDVRETERKRGIIPVA